MLVDPGLSCSAMHARVQDGLALGDAYRAIEADGRNDRLAARERQDADIPHDARPAAARPRSDPPRARRRIAVGAQCGAHEAVGDVDDPDEAGIARDGDRGAVGEPGVPWQAVGTLFGKGVEGPDGLGRQG
jgi:hypothetical protein